MQGAVGSPIRTSPRKKQKTKGKEATDNSSLRRSLSLGSPSVVSKTGRVHVDWGKMTAVDLTKPDVVKVGKRHLVKPQQEGRLAVLGVLRLLGSLYLNLKYAPAKQSDRLDMIWTKFHAMFKVFAAGFENLQSCLASLLNLLICFNPHFPFRFIFI